MPGRFLTRRATGVAAALASTALVLAACGGIPPARRSAVGLRVLGSLGAQRLRRLGPGREGAGRDQGRRQITVGTDSTYAPSEFLDTDGKTIVGFDVDLFDASPRSSA